MFCWLNRENRRRTYETDTFDVGKYEKRELSGT